MERARQHSGMSAYDRIARLYDPWSVSVVEDVPFYLEQARRSGGPVLELGVGTGRLAIPIAADGIRVIGVDASEGMLEVAREQAALAGVEVDLRLRRLPRPAGRGAGAARDDPVPLAAPHADRRGPARRPARRSRPARAGRDVHLRRLLTRRRRHRRDACPLARARARDLRARRLGRAAPHADPARARRRGRVGALARLDLGPRVARAPRGPRASSVEGLYGWFDGTPWAGHEDAIFVCRRRD